MKKKIKANIRYFLFLALTTLISAEILLHFVHPYVMNIKGDKIILPKNKRTVELNSFRNGIDSVIIQNTNNLGFIGPNPPANFDSMLTILCVGGSTTACIRITDGKDWPSLLYFELNKDFENVWLNNAGINGHSTFGHLVLMKDYVSKIKPKVVLFLIGVNDVGRKDLRNWDKSFLIEKLPWYLKLLKKSEIYNLLSDYKRNKQAKTNLLTDENMINRYLRGETVYNKEKLKDPNFAPGDTSIIVSFGKRVQMLINNCKEFNIDPVFVTQPLLLGNSVDSATGLNFGNIQLTPDINGFKYWEILQKYNAVTLKIAKDNKLFTVNLADSVPKKREYFYDMMHFTNNGAAYVSGVVYRNLSIYLKEKYPMYLK